jgi:protoheme IX farnesyltransferase
MAKHMTNLKRIYPALAWAALISALLTVTVGGVVRVTGSGLGCPDWPLCHGRIIPPADLGAWLEYSHRMTATLTVIFTGLLVTSGFLRHGWQDKRFRLVLAAPILLLAQVILGALTVLLEISPEVALVHTAVAMTFVALLAVVAVTTAGPRRWHDALISGDDARKYRWVLGLLGAATFLLIISGAYVTRTGASLACLGYPLCGDVPGGMGELQWNNMAHRGVALLVGILMLGALGTALTLRHRTVTLLTILLTSLLGLQVALGATNVIMELPAWARGAHLALAGMFFAGVILLLSALWQGRPVPRGAATVEQSSKHSLKSTLAAFFWLTKPNIIVLLLISTLAGMLAAAGGGVSWTTALPVLAGGFMCAGGAGAMNSYLDRGRDVVMRRTSWRPIPSGRVSPRAAFIFSAAISLLSLPLFLTVDPLVALLSAVAWAYYVFFYSGYLKVRTTQNIVIGGAAGAFPPLIGWVAVTGALDAPGILLFLIVFFWTPPHAWALAIVMKEEYRQVNVPMLPVVRGDAEASRQSLIYSFVLVATTVVPFALGYFNVLYLAGALALGGAFLWLAFKLYRTPGRLMAMKLYRYSTIYLALLFLVLVLDRAFLN